VATNHDFKDLFSALSAAGADFLLVGGHAVMFYTVPRFTKDLDIWVRPTLENARRVHAALSQYGAPMADLTIDDLAVPGTIFQIGVAPNRIDVVTAIDGVDFDGAWTRRTASTYDGIPISILSKPDLVANKRAVGRELDADRVQPGAAMLGSPSCA
jgi:hypothetical protein